MKKSVLKLILFFLPLTGFGQGQNANLTVEAGKFPLDGVVERNIRHEKRILAYPELREHDLLWEKYIWQIIDTREKTNSAFRYPRKYFFEVLTEGIEQGVIRAYSPENDAFQYPLNQQDALKDLVKTDTITIIDPVSLELSQQIVENKLDPEKITRYRIKEVWYFDKTCGELKVRILGVAPMITEKDDLGNFKYERPLFWVYYPDCREWLSRHTFFNENTDNQLLSWEDLFEMRRFACYITKASNVHDERLQDRLSGLDRLLESDRIRQEVFNYEHDLWSY